LEKEKDLKVVGEANDGLEAIDRLRELSPDIVVMDINMPNLDGIEATRRILSESPDTRVVALSVHSGKRFVRDMLQAGAAGYILKESVPEEMIEGIRSVLAGDVYLSRSISNIVISEFRKLLSETGPAKDTPPEPILRTKLHRPPVSADIIPRARLIELLEQGRHRAMTLISSPAGYGKSILASQWLETCGRPGVWLSLDENDSNLRVFLTYLLAAIERVFPTVELKTKALLQAVSLPPAKVLSRYLLNDVDQANEPFILVLDDYHRIKETAVHDLLVELLRYPSPMLHLALLTRRDPALPIGPLRARDQLTEIAMEPLRFTLAETRAFLERVLRVSIDEHTVAILDAKMEGWVTGLRLAALSLGHKEDVDHVLRGLKEGSHYITDYLIREALSSLPPAMARYLMGTSILDRFCAPLCDELSLSTEEQKETEDPLSGEAFIDWLEETHLFVIPLDEQHHWFRYHHFFHKLLQSQLTKRCGAEEIATHHSRASKWFTENGLIDEAIEHGVAAADMKGATRLVGQNRQEMLNRDRWYVFEKWLRMFPDAVIQQEPELLLAQAWVHYFQNRFELIPPILDAIDSLLGDRPKEQPLYGEIYLFKGAIRYLQGNGSESLKCIEAALDRIPAAHSMIRGFAEIYFGLAGQMQGQKERVVPVLSDLLNDPSLEPPRKMRVLISLVWIYSISGDLAVASTLNQQLWDLAVDYNAAAFTSWSSYNQGLIHFHRNELDAAIHHFSQAAELGHLMLRRADVDCMTGLILAYQATQQTEKADATLENLFEYIRPFNDPALLEIAHSCKARLSLRRGEAALAAGMQSMTNTSNVGAMAIWLEIPVITQCRGLLEQGAETDFHEVEKKLQEQLRLNQAHHNTSQMIEIMVLLAMAVYRQGRLDESLDVLEQVASLAEPGGWIRPFVELGRPMAELLNRLLEKNLAVDYIGKLLVAFGDDEQVVAPGESDAQTDSAWSRKFQPLVEPLTNRELEILALLEQRLQNKEIAEKLFISTTTVKTHLQNIYQKLNVTNRRQAVEKAKKIGIL